MLLKDRREERMERVADAGFLRTKNLNQEVVPNIERGRERRAVNLKFLTVGPGCHLR